MFEIVICLCVMCCVYLFFAWRRITLCKNYRLPEPPLLSGALPIIGHSYLAYGDTIHFTEVFKRISLECTDMGGVSKATLGPVHIYVITDPAECLIAFNNCTEKSSFYNLGQRILGGGLITADDQTWKIHRKLLNPMFAQRVLNSFISSINAQAQQLVNTFADKLGSGPFAYEQHLLVWNLEAVCKTIMGVDISDGKKENSEYVNALNNIGKIIMQRVANVWYQSEIIYNLSQLKSEEERLVKIIRNKSREVLLSRKKIINNFDKQAIDMQDDFRPFIDHMLLISNEKEGLTDQEILDEVNTLLVAGYDTTGHTFAFIFMMLGAHKEVQNLIYKELESLSLNSDRDVDKYDLPKLVYTEAVIKETLRLYPIVPFYARQTATDINVTKYTLRAGCHVMASTFGMGRSPAWGADVEQFRPERWLDPTAIPENINTFSAFGIGKRSCIGKTFSLMVMKTTLVHIMRNYKITSHSYNPPLKVEVILNSAVPLYISLEKRK